MKSPYHLLRLTFYLQWGTLFQTWFQLDSFLTPIQFLAFMVRLKFRPQRTHGKISSCCTFGFYLRALWSKLGWHSCVLECDGGWLHSKKNTCWAHNWLNKRDKPCCILYSMYNFVVEYIWRTRVCWALLCLCHPFIIFEECQDWNPECCRGKRMRYQRIHP